MIKNPDRRNEVFMLHLRPRVTKTCRESRLERRVRRMFQDAYCDVTFHCSDGVQVRAHRSCLGANPVLEALFQKELAVRDFSLEQDSTVVTAFVEHFYEQLDLSTTNVDPLKLFCMADAYRESSLKRRLVEVFFDAGDDSTQFLEAYKTAASLPASPLNRALKRKAEAGIAGHLDKLMKTNELTRFVSENSELASQLLNSLAEDKTKSC